MNYVGLLAIPKSSKEYLTKARTRIYWDFLLQCGLQGRFQYFSNARMWNQCTPQKLDIVSAVKSLYLNNLAR